MRYFILILLFIQLKSEAQEMMSIIRQDDYDYNLSRDVVSRIPSKGIIFEYDLNNKEDIYLSIKSDSVYKNVTSPSVYAYFPKSINYSDINLTFMFSDGNIVKIKKTFVGDDGYVEYQLNEKLLYFLKNKKCISFYFSGLGKYDNYEKSYFIDFFNLLKS